MVRNAAPTPMTSTTVPPTNVPAAIPPAMLTDSSAIAESMRLAPTRSNTSARDVMSVTQPTPIITAKT